MAALAVEDFVRQRLGDRQTSDYFPGTDELRDICFRFVVCRTTRLTLPLVAVETRGIPLPVPGDSSIGKFWAYSMTQYTQGIWPRILQCCAFDEQINQPTHRYALFQANAYVNDAFPDPQPDINEISLLVEFEAQQEGTVNLTGYPINLNRLMYDIFTAIANDIGKLAIYQSTLGGATDLRQAADAAQREAGKWLRGSLVRQRPLRGARRSWWT